MESLKEKCIALRTQGRTLPEIVQLTGSSKSSVYGHIRDIPLSPVRLQSIREASGKRIREFALARKGKSKRPFNPLVGWNRANVSLVAHLLFDGGVYPSSGCTYNSRSSALLLRVEEHMRIAYDFEPTRYTNPLTGVLRISYHNVALAGYMKIKIHELLQMIGLLPDDLKTEFLRAFFDDEGCIDFRPEKNRRSIRGYQKDMRILKIIKALLNDFNIVARVVAPNEVVIVGKENLILFEEKINFSPGVYMNGNRSNSRWKKHMEKRELLKQAIASFKS